MKSLFKTALLTLGCALSLALFLAPTVQAADAGKPLPLTTTIEKAAHPAENTPPFVLHLKNTSHESIKVTGKVLLSVQSHNMAKARPVPEHVIAAGQSMTIAELAALDKVIISAEGYAPLEIEVVVK